MGDQNGGTTGRWDVVKINVWRIENDPGRPGRIYTRDESGSVGFESLDGGRSWQRTEQGAAAR